jgi:hypothetical protein
MSESQNKRDIWMTAGFTALRLGTPRDNIHDRRA